MAYPTEAKTVASIVSYSEDRLRKPADWWAIVLPADATAPTVYAASRNYNDLQKSVQADYPDVRWIHAVDLLVTTALRNTAALPSESQDVTPWTR